jgi:hypothetical protein
MAVLNKVIYAPRGSKLRHFAWRNDVTGVVQGPHPPFWVSKNA